MSTNHHPPRILQLETNFGLFQVEHEGRNFILSWRRKGDVLFQRVDMFPTPAAAAEAVADSKTGVDEWDRYNRQFLREHYLIDRWKPVA